MGGHKITGEEKITEQNREKNIQEKEGIEKKKKKSNSRIRQNIYIYEKEDGPLILKKKKKKQQQRSWFEYQTHWRQITITEINEKKRNSLNE